MEAQLREQDRRLRDELAAASRVALAKQPPSASQRDDLAALVQSYACAIDDLDDDFQIPQPFVSHARDPTPEEKESVFKLRAALAKDPAVQDLRRRVKESEVACAEARANSQAAKPPRIYFCSRTHQQIVQVTSELKATIYRPRMAVLGSREQVGARLSESGTDPARISTASTRRRSILGTVMSDARNCWTRRAAPTTTSTAVSRIARNYSRGDGSRCGTWRTWSRPVAPPAPVPTLPPKP